MAKLKAQKRKKYEWLRDFAHEFLREKGLEPVPFREWDETAKRLRRKCELLGDFCIVARSEEGLSLLVFSIGDDGNVHVVASCPDGLELFGGA